MPKQIKIKIQHYQIKIIVKIIIKIIILMKKRISYFTCKSKNKNAYNINWDYQDYLIINN